MIVDTSALATIAFGEPATDELIAVLDAGSSARISAGNLLEAFIVIDRRQNGRAATILEQLLDQFGLIVVPVTEAQVNIARVAYQRFGKGSGHPAQLNYGDCFAYSLAKAMNEPLLFIGNDFSHTGITPAL